MKDNLNFWLTICAGALAILSIFTILLSPVTSTLILETELPFQDVYFAKSGTIVPLFGYAGLIAGGVLCILCAFKGSRKLGIIALITLIVSSIIILMTRQFFVFAHMDEFSSYQYKILDDWYSKLGLGPILGGVIGIVSASLVFIVFFVFDEQGNLAKGKNRNKK